MLRFIVFFCLVRVFRWKVFRPVSDTVIFFLSGLKIEIAVRRLGKQCVAFVQLSSSSLEGSTFLHNNWQQRAYPNFTVYLHLFICLTTVNTFSKFMQWFRAASITLRLLRDFGVKFESLQSKHDEFIWRMQTLSIRTSRVLLRYL